MAYFLKPRAQELARWDRRHKPQAGGVALGLVATLPRWQAIVPSEGGTGVTLALKTRQYPQQGRFLALLQRAVSVTEH